MGAFIGYRISIIIVWIIPSCYISPEGGLFAGNLNDMRGSLRIKPPMYKRFVEKNNRIHTNEMLENGLMYLN
jgi:hypothetical protein